ncbi:MAG: alpha/beta hydrolase [Candidatus Eremiobacterota bacterium]
MKHVGINRKFVVVIALWMLLITAVIVCLWHKKSFSKDSDEYKVFSDVLYAEIPGFDKNLTGLDLYVPKKGDKLPVMVFIHGGAWKMGDKRNHSKKPLRFIREGYIFASINYRMSPAVTFPVYVQDVAKALGWIYNNIATYRGDRDKIFIMGHSAGAHLAALVSIDEKYLEENGLDLDILKGVILLDGAGYDIPKVKELNKSLFNRLYKPAFGDDPAVLKEASPLYHVEKDKDIPPFFIIYAGSRELSKIESTWLGESLKNAGVYAELYHAGDKNHGTLNRKLGDDEDKATEKIMEFLKKITDGKFNIQ